MGENMYKIELPTDMNVFERQDHIQCI